MVYAVMYNQVIMNIVIITPLFPPDIGDPAPYTKELAKRLAGHTVTVWCYGHLPEKVAGVEIHTVSKRSSLMLRMLRLTKALYSNAKQDDILCVQNGASVELPAVIVSLLTRTPLVYAISDAIAQKHTQQSLLRGIVAKIARKRAVTVIEDSSGAPLPLHKPEVLPLSPYPESAIEQYETAWKHHLSQLNEIFSHAKS